MNENLDLTKILKDCPKKPKEDLPKGTIVLAKDEWDDDWSIRIYYGEGQTYTDVYYDCYTVAYEQIIRVENLILDKDVVENIEITDENNYGRSYWEQFKEE